MSNNFYLYLVLAIAFSLFIASFQYFYKNKDKSSTKTILFVLRFLSIFLLLLLWINPKIIKNKIEIIKPSLVVLADNSKSISSLKQEINISNIVDEIKNNKELNDKFTLDYYTFSGDISLTDTLDFKKNTTNIFKTLQSTDKIYKKSIAPIIIITDGNQTLGND
ncbi:MAG TPA: VWA domain-containing protein, partial [Flavobacteriaceae bacterium]|nr:VWA domain-containing protein [Flavobacteriaceae bacterium]